MAAKAAGAMPPPPEPAGRAPPIAVSSLNPNLVAAEYAVRGEIVLRAQQIARDLEAGVGGYGFERTVACNIGNPQVLGQKPITFFRQARVHPRRRASSSLSLRARARMPGGRAAQRQLQGGGGEGGSPAARPPLNTRTRTHPSSRCPQSRPVPPGRCWRCASAPRCWRSRA